MFGARQTALLSTVYNFILCLRRRSSGCSPAEIVDLNPTGDMDVSVVSVVCCQVEVSATS
jgi:hypothetical protein